MTANQFMAGVLITVHALLVLFGVVRWKQLDTGCRYTWGWALFGLIARLLQLSLHHPPDRLVVAHFYYPVSAILAACALAPYQATRRASDAVRLTGLGYLIVWAILTPLVEDLHKFSLVTAPLRAALVAVIAARTIGERNRVRVRPFSEDRGILIAASFAVLYAATGIVAPFLATDHGANADLLRRLLMGRDVTVLCAMIPMLWAFMLHVPRDERTA